MHSSLWGPVIIRTVLTTVTKGSPGQYCTTYLIVDWLCWVVGCARSPIAASESTLFDHTHQCTVFCTASETPSMLCTTYRWYLHSTIARCVSLVCVCTYVHLASCHCTDNNNSGRGAARYVRVEYTKQWNFYPEVNVYSSFSRYDAFASCHVEARISQELEQIRCRFTAHSEAH